MDSVGSLGTGALVTGLSAVTWTLRPDTDVEVFTRSELRSVELVESDDMLSVGAIYDFLDSKAGGLIPAREIAAAFVVFWGISSSKDVKLIKSSDIFEDIL